MPGRKEKIKPRSLLAKTNKELLAEKKSIKTKSKKKVKVRKVKLREDSATQVKALNRGIKRPKSAKQAIDSSQTETKLDREKRLIILTGVTFFMVLIAFFWIINVSQVFEKMRVTDKEDNDLSNTWQELSKGLDQRLDQMKVSLDKIDELKDNLVAEQYNVTSTEKLPSNNLGSTTEDEITEEQVKKLKEILENE